jgi:hypothetical protein
MKHTIKPEDLCNTYQTVIASSCSTNNKTTKQLKIVSLVTKYGLASNFVVLSTFRDIVIMYQGNDINKAVEAYNDIDC